MSAEDAIAWRIASPCPGCGTHYGMSTAFYVTRDVLRTSLRPDLLRAALRLAGLAAGGELEWEYAERVVIDLGDAIGRKANEVRGLWSWARRNGEARPSRAPVGDGSMAAVLADADPADKAALLSSLGVRVDWLPATDRAKVSMATDGACVGKRVGGGT